MAKRFLIIGGASMLGAHLGQGLINKGYELITTDHRERGDFMLDLSASPDHWPDLPDELDGVFISAAMTDQNACEKYPELAQKINVTHMSMLIDMFVAKGTHVLFPSTNLVLPCQKPSQSVDTEYAPIGAYARMKAEVEKKYLSNPDVTICRLAKVITLDMPLIKNWVSQLKSGQKVTALSDLIMSPVSSLYTVNILTRLLEISKGGLWQISGAQEISYYDLTLAIASYLDVDPQLVSGQTSQEAGVALASAPQHPSLDAYKLTTELSIYPQRVEDMVRDLLYDL